MVTNAIEKEKQAAKEAVGGLIEVFRDDGDGEESSTVWILNHAPADPRRSRKRRNYI